MKEINSKIEKKLGSLLQLITEKDVDENIV